MENKIKTFTLFVRSDRVSNKIANRIRKINRASKLPLSESNNGDLVIAIGGDGTFIDSVTSTNFCKEKVYVGVHTGTLGFMQNLSESDIYALIKDLSLKKEIKTRKVFVSDVTVTLINNKQMRYNSLNECLVVGKDYSKITFSEYVNGEHFQNISGNGIIIATQTGDTAYSMNAGGSVDFSNNYQLTCTLETPIKNATYDRFISNPIICPEILITSKDIDKNNISVVIDGIPRELEDKVLSVQVIMTASSYINKFELFSYSKVKTVKEKILGVKI